ncbi:MAG: 2Fe-2S iron-sulfur cluster binding domain-containing protein [Deltaproteobacteria bacterium]|nr:2Fe-2S iron-sulfur cluster binding domain-containing protein [Deltaproteobacteria bacterium]
MAFQVEFKKSGKTLPWHDKYDSILDLAEDNGVEMESLCRQGVCGSCKARLLAGEVEMDTTDGLEEEDARQGMILPCVAVPKTDVIIDA